MLKVTDKEFQKLVDEAVLSLPGKFRSLIRNTAIAVEDHPSPELLEEMEIDPPDTLLGLYQGVPLTERGLGYGNTTPDVILIFKAPILSICSTPEEIREQVRETVIHEVAHYFGMSDDEIDAL